MKLAYREYGEGQPLIILHGLFGQSDNWNTLAKNFAEQGFRVFTVDQRNHGLSPHDDVWNYQVMAQDLKQFIQDHNIAHPILIGHSMGGKTVLFFEKNFPGEAKKIVVVDMAAKQYPAHHDQVIAALESVDFKTISTRKEADAAMSRYISDFGTKQFLLKNIYWKEDDEKQMAWRFNLPVISKHYDSVREPVPMYSSAVPTLIISGEKSDYVNTTDIEDFKKRFENVAFAAVADAGHWVHAEKPKEFFDEVLKFIKA